MSDEPAGTPAPFALQPVAWPRGTSVPGERIRRVSPTLAAADRAYRQARYAEASRLFLDAADALAPSGPGDQFAAARIAACTNAAAALAMAGAADSALAARLRVMLAREPAGADEALRLLGGWR